MYYVAFVVHSCLSSKGGWGCDTQFCFEVIASDILYPHSLVNLIKTPISLWYFECIYDESLVAGTLEVNPSII